MGQDPSLMRGLMQLGVIANTRLADRKHVVPTNGLVVASSPRPTRTESHRQP